MTMTKIAVVVGVVLVGFFCYLVAIGSRSATALLVTALALLVLVGGGNLVSGRDNPHAAKRPAPLPSEHTVPEQTVAEQTVSEQAVPQQTVPQQSVSESQRPATRDPGTAG